MDSSGELIQALRPVLAEFNRMAVRYCIGGSVASSIHGAGRSTLDVDVAADLNAADASGLIRMLSADYYVSDAAAQDAVRRKSCFNLIHLATSFKIDIFVSKRREFDLSVFDRAITESLGTSDPLSARFASAEDIILIKLEWYRLGNATSARQWSDVTRVAKLYGSRLDRNYINHWAGDLRLRDLVEQLFVEIDAG